MDKKEKELKILFVRQVFESTLISSLTKCNIDKHNFYKGKVSAKKIDALFETVYNDIELLVERGSLIKTGQLTLSDIQVRKGRTKNEK